MAAIAEGTAQTSVTSPAAGRSGSSRTLLARISRPPEERVKNSSTTETSKEIEVEARTAPVSSSSSYVPCAQRTRSTALWCSIATAFGFPVEPEV